MFKKIANIADKDTIETEFKIKYKFPKLYTQKSVIDGTSESTISIITSENLNNISFGIWGLLPSNYQDEWSDFQKVYNTLHVHKDELHTNLVIKNSFDIRHCAIIITGFYIYHLHNGNLYPYYVYQKNRKPFLVAGIYNTLDDGFITCSIVTSKATGIVQTIQNLCNSMPIIITNKDYKTWLNSKLTLNETNELLDNATSSELTAHPIAKEFFKNDISFESMLAPVYYNDIPIP
ncbi:SOS response-associated peptidase family protein [Aquimarina sp. 433]